MEDREMTSQRIGRQDWYRHTQTALMADDYGFTRASERTATHTGSWTGVWHRDYSNHVGDSVRIFQDGSWAMGDQRGTSSVDLGHALQTLAEVK